MCWQWWLCCIHPLITSKFSSESTSWLVWRQREPYYSTISALPASLLYSSPQISHRGPSWWMSEYDFFFLLSPPCIFCSVFVLSHPSPMFNTDKTLLEQCVGPQMVCQRHLLSLDLRANRLLCLTAIKSWCISCGLILSGRLYWTIQLLTPSDYIQSFFQFLFKYTFNSKSAVSYFE